MSSPDTLTMPQLKLLNVADLAERFQVGESKIRQLVRDEGLPHLRLGKHLRFRPDAVDRWLDSRVEVESTVAAAQQRAVAPYDWSRAHAS